MQDDSHNTLNDVIRHVTWALGYANGQAGGWNYASDFYYNINLLDFLSRDFGQLVALLIFCDIRNVLYTQFHVRELRLYPLIL